MDDEQDAGSSGVQVGNKLHDVIRDKHNEDVPTWSELSEISLKDPEDNHETDESYSSDNNDEEKNSPEARTSGGSELPTRDQTEDESRSLRRSIGVETEGSQDGSGTSEDANSVPGKFRQVPGYVVLAHRHDPEMFADFVDLFFQKKKWPTFASIPREFREVCKNNGVTAESFTDMPGFAPEWMFHLRLMDYELFWNSIHHFFDKKSFPSWASLPKKITYWFQNLKLGEYEFPSESRLDKLPNLIKKRLKNFLERRLRLTEEEFTLWG